MQKIFDEVNSLDQRCRNKYHLTEDIMMEHASTSMMNYIDKNFSKDKKILIVCGSGNNGADGLALGRLLHEKYKISLYIPFGVKSDMAKIQLSRVEQLNVNIVSKIKKADIIVDCLFGSGLNRNLNEKSIMIIDALNKQKAFKIACDIPSGINHLGQISTTAFYANITFSMGALKKSLFTDIVKEYIGKIKVSNLGIQRKIYETNSNCYLLDKSDLKLPLRDNKLSNKRTYGHLCVVLGEKIGAGLLCADAGFSFGSGLITVLSQDAKKVPNYIMQSTEIPNNASAICLGMGLGPSYNKNLLRNDIPKVIDADLFYDVKILDVLKQKNIVITPHPKEFCSLLKITKIANISIVQLQNNRFKYVNLFTQKYKKIVLLLKGTNVIISQNKKTYINSLGTSILSKGGSGDVLCGLIGSLLAQGQSTLESTINGSLAHTIAASNYGKNNYSMTPLDLVEEIKKL